jgi:hypothetical protein
MTLLESLKIQLQYAMQKYGENAPVSLGIKQDPTELLNFHVGFRKAKH